MIYPIRLYGDPILRSHALPVRDFGEIAEIAQSMFATMVEAGGVGLAGPQVGLRQRIFVVLEYDFDDKGAPIDPPKAKHVFVNPKITASSGEELGEEGCLSLPGIYSERVPRALQITVEYQDETGTSRSLDAEGYFARAIQHEYDHLDGVLFFDRLSRSERQAFLEEHHNELAEFQRRSRILARESAVKFR